MTFSHIGHDAEQYDHDTMQREVDGTLAPYPLLTSPLPDLTDTQALELGAYLTSIAPARDSVVRAHNGSSLAARNMSEWSARVLEYIVNNPCSPHTPGLRERRLTLIEWVNS